MKKQVLIIAVIGMLMLSGCSLLNSGNDAAHPTDQPTTETVEQQKVFTANTSLHTPLTGTPDVTKPPDTVTDEPERNPTTVEGTEDNGDPDPSTEIVTEDSDSDTGVDDSDDTGDDSPPETETDDGNESGENETDTGDNESDSGENESDDLPKQATVIDVHSANTYTVEFTNGRTETVTLLGITVPATDVDDVDPEAWGYNDTEYNRSRISQEGVNAYDEASEIEGDIVDIVFSSGEVRRNDDGHLVAYVNHEEHGNYAEHLLDLGYARTNGESHILSDEFGEAEYFAKEDGNGVWYQR